MATALYGLVGVALGALTRNTVAAIIAHHLGHGIEAGILGSLVPDVAHWLPAGAAIALNERRHGSPRCLSPTAAALVLAGWALLISGIAARFSLRSEAH